VVLFFLVAPVLVIVPMAFSSSEFLEFPPPGFSTEWFSAFFDDTAWMDAIFLTLRVGLGAMVIAVVLGTMAAYALARTRLRLRGLSEGVLMLPMVIPTIVYAVGAYLLVLPMGLVGSELLLMCAHAILALPFVVLYMVASISGTDRRLELVAQSLGASRWVAFRTVTLPLIAPAVLASALITLVMSADETVVALFLTSNDAPTLPVKVYNSIQYELNPLVPVAATVVVGGTVAVAAVFFLLRWVVARATGGAATPDPLGGAQATAEGAKA
jgi:putative spermidine/putrescine transport system permease protein